jgi:hypothetical protein
LGLDWIVFIESKNRTRNQAINILNIIRHLAKMTGSFSLQGLRLLENDSLFQIKMTNIGMQLQFYDAGCIFRKEKSSIRGHHRTQATQGRAKLLHGIVKRILSAPSPMPNQSAGRRAEAVLQNRNAASGLRARRQKLCFGGGGS